MNTKVTIIDYGIGNLLSVQRAFEKCEAEVLVTSDVKIIEASDRLVLPGVGAFADGIQGLKDYKVYDAVLNYLTKQRPFLGICVGMQMLFDEADEFGIHEGLKIISGKVSKISETDSNGKKHKIPHIGWNNLKHPKNNIHWNNSILSKIEENDSVYFVHSYAGNPTDEKVRLADTYYNGVKILAALQKDHIFGCQFHPEKSGDVGMNILKGFLSI
jgi:glutamine amidotransferase